MLSRLARWRPPVLSHLARWCPRAESFSSLHVKQMLKSRSFPTGPHGSQRNPHGSPRYPHDIPTTLLKYSWGLLVAANFEHGLHAIRCMVKGFPFTKTRKVRFPRIPTDPHDITTDTGKLPRLGPRGSDTYRIPATRALNRHE